MTVAYVTMPGTSGNYVSSADVNLLDADTAHVHQSKGRWGTYYQGVSIATSTALTPEYGDSHLRFQAGLNAVSSVTSGTAGIGTGPGDVAVTAGVEYTASAIMATQAGSIDVKLGVEFFNVGGTIIGAVSYGNNPTPAANTWVAVSKTITAPTGAVTAAIVIRAGTSTAGQVTYVDTACFRTGTSAVFVPSLRIVGDLDMRARFAATDATPASAETLIGQRSGNSGYAMTLGTGGELVVYHGTGSGTRVETSSGLALVAATDTEVQSTLDISAGTWTHYKNGVQFDTSGSFATTAGSPYAGPLAVGADSAGTSGNWDGDIYYCEVRDGIDGPVVRRFDADDLIGLV